MNIRKFFRLIIVICVVFSLLSKSAPVSADEPLLNPRISASVHGDGWISGEEWLFDSQVTISIDDPNTPQSPDFTTYTTASNTRPGQVGGSFIYDPNYDFNPGFTITVSEGTTTKNYRGGQFESGSVGYCK